jgi:peptidoglycan/LPS O-acetylase OafA/YrhL
LRATRYAALLLRNSGRRRTLARKGKGLGFVSHHSLSIAATAILIIWIVAYSYSDPGTHLGSFFGNAIADWSGVVVMVFATKHLYEKGSSESRRPEGKLPPGLEWLRDHSLTIFLLATGLIWIAIYLRVDSEGKWGQVVGNIVSEWTQILGLVLLTKHLIELHSKESER